MDENFFYCINDCEFTDAYKCRYTFLKEMRYEIHVPKSDKYMIYKEEDGDVIIYIDFINENFMSLNQYRENRINQIIL